MNPWMRSAASYPPEPLGVATCWVPVDNQHGVVITQCSQAFEHDGLAAWQIASQTSIRRTEIGRNRPRLTRFRSLKQPSRPQSHLIFRITPSLSHVAPPPAAPSPPQSPPRASRAVAPCNATSTASSLTNLRSMRRSCARSTKGSSSRSFAISSLSAVLEPARPISRLRSPCTRCVSANGFGSLTSSTSPTSSSRRSLLARPVGSQNAWCVTPSSWCSMSSATYRSPKTPASSSSICSQNSISTPP